ncbi:hypothetical protein JCM10207_001134 [Rhodosporidiobolus poonsookiae]
MAAPPAPFYTLDLSPPQQALIAHLTPFRFHLVPDTGALEPYLPLASPPAVPYPLILTPPRPTDVPRAVETLNHPAVAFNLVGPPYPYTTEIALEYATMRGKTTETYFASLAERTAALLSSNANSDPAAAAAAAELSATALPRDWLPDGCPMNNIRRADTGEWVGDMGVTRWRFEDVRADEERERLCRENDAKVAGDPETAWSFGFFLNPTYHGQRLMSPCLSALVTYLSTFLRSEHIHGAAFADNVPSVRTQERNGFVRYGSWVREIAEKRGGGKKEVVVLKWEGGK